MFIETDRLYLISTPLELMRRRLREDDFEADLALPDGRTLHVHCPPEWPGEAVDMYPGLIKRLEADPDFEEMGGTIVERESGEAVGGMSFREVEDEPGTIELGYGINPSRWNRGYATEMARAMVAWAKDRPEVKRIVSSCLIDNFGSIRVLEKAGFRRTGERDGDEGRLILWEV